MTINRNIAPDVLHLPVEEMLAIGHESLVFANGFRVFLINSGIHDISRFDFVFDAGNRKASNPLLASMTGRLLKEGTVRHSGSEIAEILDFFGAYLETSADHDKAVVTLYCVNKYIGNVLPLLRELLAEPLFPEEKLMTEVRNKRSDFLVGIERVGFIARLRYGELLFGEDHPYGKALKLSDFDEIDQILTRGFYQKNYSRTSGYLVVSGKLSAQHIALTEQLFGTFDFLSDHVNGKDQLPAARQITGSHFIQRDNAVQSALRVGRPMFNRSHADYPGFMLLNLIVGGYFGSRLMKNIREDKGYTYGIGSSLVSLRDGGYFSVSAEVGAPVTSNALKEVYHELEVLQNENVGSEEMDLVRNFMRGSLMRSFDGPFARADRLRTLIDSDLPWNHYVHFLKALETFTPSGIRELACRYFSRDSLTELVVGKLN